MFKYGIFFLVRLSFGRVCSIIRLRQSGSVFEFLGSAKWDSEFMFLFVSRTWKHFSINLNIPRIHKFIHRTKVVPPLELTIRCGDSQKPIDCFQCIDFNLLLRVIIHSVVKQNLPLFDFGERPTLVMVMFTSALPAWKILPIDRSLQGARWRRSRYIWATRRRGRSPICGDECECLGERLAILPHTAKHIVGCVG